MAVPRLPDELRFKRAAADRLGTAGVCAFDTEMMGLLGGRPLSAFTLDALTDLGTLGEPSALAARRLASAALRDICGLPHWRVAELLGYKGAHAKNESQRWVKLGRGLWRQLPSWPWWCLRRELRWEWWLDESVAEAWRRWRRSPR
jgi:hypothetical protein